MAWLAAVDHEVRRLLMVLSCVLLLLMVTFTGYTIVMRYVFDEAPFWGDTVSVFCNIWSVMLAHAITVRERSEIAMQRIYTRIPVKPVMVLDVSWSVMTLAVGLLLVRFGYQAANGVNSEYWELDGLSKRYPMMILPSSGSLIALASLINLAEDRIVIKRGTYRLRVPDHGVPSEEDL